MRETRMDSKTASDIEWLGNYFARAIWRTFLICGLILAAGIGYGIWKANHPSPKAATACPCCQLK